MTRAIRTALLCLLLALAVISAAPVLAAAPSNDGVTDAPVLHLPASGSITDISQATLEAGELAASCATNDDDDDSVWFRVNVPTGVLTFSTTTDQTLFDTVITLFRLPIVLNGPGSLDEIACAVNPGNAATLSATVAGGNYFVRVASDDDLPLGARTLNYDISFAPPSPGHIPVNDAIENARVIVLNKSSKVTNFEYATMAPGDVTPTCASRKPSATLWYRFSGVSGNVLISAEGSLLAVSATDYHPGPGLAVYEGLPPSISGVACDDSSGINGAGRLTLVADPTKTYFVLVYHDLGPVDLTAPSKAKLLVATLAHQLLINGDFNDGLAGWVVKNSTDDIIKSDNATPFNNNAFRFLGSPGENSQLKQTLVVPSTLTIPADSTLGVSYAIRSNLLITPRDGAKLLVLLTYADGAVVKHKTTLGVPATSLATIGLNYEFVVARKNPVKVQVVFKNTATSGDFAIDGVKLTLAALNATRQVQSGVLPLPMAPIH